MGAAALAGGGGAPPLGPRGWEGRKGGRREGEGVLAPVGLRFPYSSPWAVLVDFVLPPLYTWVGAAPQHTSSTQPTPRAPARAPP